MTSNDYKALSVLWRSRPIRWAFVVMVIGCTAALCCVLVVG
jgi:hypothetical protein